MQPSVFDDRQDRTVRPQAPEVGVTELIAPAPPVQQRFAGKQFVLALLVARRDYLLLWELVQWMRDLEGQKIAAHVVLTHEHRLPAGLVRALQEHLRETFAGEIILNPAPFQLMDETWPLGPSWSFACTAHWAYRAQADFLLLEPDVTVLKPGWFDRLRRAYYGAGKPFMGTREAESCKHIEHMPGNGIYPWDVTRFYDLKHLERPWDIYLAERGIVRDGLVAFTPLIQQVWCVRDWRERREKNGLPPTPPRQPGGVINAISFPNWQSVQEMISPEAVVFHRCKDGSLIERLRESRQLIGMR